MLHKNIDQYLFNMFDIYYSLCYVHEGKWFIDESARNWFLLENMRTFYLMMLGGSGNNVNELAEVRFMLERLM